MTIPFASSFTVTRYAAGSYVNGTWSEGATSTVTIQASVQPAPGKEILLLEEGQRTRDVRICYSDTELFTAWEGDSKRADRVTVDGVAFEVHKVEPWNPAGFGVGHWRALLLKVNP